MGFVDEWPSRMQGQVFFEVKWGRQHFFVRFKNRIEFFCGGLPEGL